MAEIADSTQALSGFERISDLIDDAVHTLARHPLTGRQRESGMRELDISQGRTGYVALYGYEPAYDATLILAIRHQREAGFRS